MDQTWPQILFLLLYLERLLLNQHTKVCSPFLSNNSSKNFLIKMNRGTILKPTHNFKAISTALFEHLVGRSLLFWTPLSSVTWIKQGDFISALFWAYDKIIFNVLPEKMMTRQSQYFTVFIAHLDNSLSFLQPLLLSWTITRLPLVLLKKSLQRKSKKTGRSSMHATKPTV